MTRTDPIAQLCEVSAHGSLVNPYAALFRFDVLQSIDDAFDLGTRDVAAFEERGVPHAKGFEVDEDLPGVRRAHPKAPVGVTLLEIGSP